MSLRIDQACSAPDRPLAFGATSSNIFQLCNQLLGLSLVAQVVFLQKNNVIVNFKEDLT